MPKNLKTDWKRIGRSGPTIDGRVIDADALRQAAKNYDKNLYSAVINYEHGSWLNLGSVEALRVEDNEEGGVDLFAIIAPNDTYLSLNKDGQKVHTSMELDFDFRNTGEAYLTGLAATDRPASAGTTQMAFSIEKKTTLLVSDYTESNTQHFTDTPDEQAPSWFTKFFSKSAEADMDTKALAALQLSFAALQADFTALTQSDNGDDGHKDHATNEYASKEAVDELLTKFTALEAKLAGDDEGEGNAADVKFTALQTAFDDLNAKFTAALGEQAGTDAGDHTGDTENLDQYV